MQTSVYPSVSSPMLRMTRRPSSASSSGPRSLSHPDSHTTSGDSAGSSGMAEAAQRLMSASLPESGVGHRLRAVLDRFETPVDTSATSSCGAMPPSPPEPESDFDLPPARIARTSIKELFQNALREPSDSTQNPRLSRRASFNVVGSPKISQSGRKGTSDDERELLAELLAKSQDGRSDILPPTRAGITNSKQQSPMASSTGWPSPGSWSDTPTPESSPLRPSSPKRPNEGPLRSSPSRDALALPVVEYSDDAEATPKLKPVDTVTQPKALVDDHTTGFSTIPVVPAPPGAYHATPTPSNRKGILKTRFDSDLGSPGLVKVADTDVNCVMLTTKGTPSFPSLEDISPLSLSPSRRKGLRLVDEYGRARRFTEDGKEVILDHSTKSATVGESPKCTSLSKPPVADVTVTPRRRAKMRQVDVLGNEFTEEQKPTNGKILEARASKNVLSSRLARSLGELSHELARQEEAFGASMPSRTSCNYKRLTDLAAVSKGARVERNKLASKLRLERHAEVEIPDHLCRTRHSVLLPSETRAFWWFRKWRLALCIMAMEVCVLLVGYRMASIYAKQAWLATHHDPFFPGLYLRKAPPSYITRSGSLPAGWSAFVVSNGVGRVGVRGFVERIGEQLWEGILSWRLEPWETWGSPAAGPPVPQPWPPS